MKTVDIVIIGGGMVGLALASLLAESPCRIAIIEQSSPVAPNGQLTSRVSAITQASQMLLETVGAWQKISTDRLSSYNKMTVWEKESFAKIYFDNNDKAIQQLGLSQLGVIVENQQIHYALWQQVNQQDNITFIYSQPQTLGVSENGAFLGLANGDMLSTKLVVGADGANSWVRRQQAIPLVSRDYQHTALVCNVRTVEKHQHTARQVFSPDSILAFLPLNDEHLCSIVWSLPPEQAEILRECDEITFQKQLSIAFDNQLGLCELQSMRTTYPLVARYARDFAQPRIALIGDAAHTIHPLAGLGVNLGFADAQTLANSILHALSAGKDMGDYRQLREFERVRKVEAVKVLVAMEGLKQLFSGNHPIKKLVRGVGLSLTNKNGLVKKFLIEQAVGI